MTKAFAALGLVFAIAIGVGNVAQAADPAYEWATSNGASFDENLVESAMVYAKGGFPQEASGYQFFAGGRTYGATSAEEALALLGPGPAKNTLTAAVVYSTEDGSYTAGYIIARKVSTPTSEVTTTTVKPVTVTTVKPASSNQDDSSTEVSTTLPVTPTTSTTIQNGTSTTTSTVDLGNESFGKPAVVEEPEANTASIQVATTSRSGFVSDSVFFVVGALGGVCLSAIFRKRQSLTK
jgi:hypothetical protein